MSKQPDRDSPFNKLLELRQARHGKTVEQPNVEEVQPSRQLTVPPAKLAKSADPDFTKFTVYVRRTTHRAAKLRAVGEGRELSEVVEELLTRWAAEKG
jgi:hypothetical protein